MKQNKEIYSKLKSFDKNDLFSDKKFCNALELKSYVLFWYTLEGLNHTQKVKFNYLLAGRNTTGIIEEFNGFRLANGVIKIPISNALMFEEILEGNDVKFHKKNILE